MDDNELRDAVRQVADDYPHRLAVTAAMHRRHAARLRHRSYLTMAAAASAVVFVVGGIGLFAGTPGHAPDLQRPASTNTITDTPNPCDSTEVAAPSSPVATPDDPAATAGTQQLQPSCATATKPATTLTVSPETYGEKGSGPVATTVTPTPTATTP